MTDLQQGPLHDRHVALGAKLADFGGWEMPIQYPGGGCSRSTPPCARRSACSTSATSARASCARARARAVDFVNDRLTNDLRRVGVGQAQYTLCCDDASGGVVDDLIAYVRSEDEVFLIPNAANTSQVVGRLPADAPGGIEVEDLHRTLAVLAVQGPRSARAASQALGLPTDHDYMTFTGADWQRPAGRRLPHRLHRRARLRAAAAVGRRRRVWDALLERRAARRAALRPRRARHAAHRDGLPAARPGPVAGDHARCRRARAGPSAGTSPASGAATRCSPSASGAPPACCGASSRSTAASRARTWPCSRDGDAVGEVTSGTFSPTRRVGIGLALLDAVVAEGDEVTVDVRGRTSVMRVVAPALRPEPGALTA